MPKFNVDVKAFINIEVEAADEAEARSLADDYVETSLSPSDEEIEGWNDVQQEEGQAGRILATAGFSVDGYSEVEAE